MQVLLINPPWEKSSDDNRARFKVISCLPSLGLGYIAACLEKEGVKVNILDLNVEGIGLNDLSQALSLFEFKPQFIGITAAATTIYVAKDIAKICKEVFPEAKTVM